VVGLFFDLSMPDADFLAALVVLLVASISFIGIGMMTAVLPLISPEKGAQLGFVAQGVLLVVSGVYYPVDVLPAWMEKISAISPATYALDGVRAGDPRRRRAQARWGPDLAQARRDRSGLASRSGWRCSPPASGYAKRNGKLKRSAEDRPTAPDLAVAGRRQSAQTLKPRARSCSRPSSVILSGPHGGIQTQLILKSAAMPPARAAAQRLPGLVLDHVGQRAGGRGQRHVRVTTRSWPTCTP
jgi:ABC-2 type transport system permease protein